MNEPVTTTPSNAGAKTPARTGISSLLPGFAATDRPWWRRPGVRAVFLVGVLAVAAYANSVGNGFAFDDDGIIVQNDLVREGRLAELVGSPYWPESAEGTGLYRPLTVASFAVEWALFDGSPRGFHLVNVAAHAAVSLLVLALVASFLPLLPAALGAAVFAIHPVHTEAVANVVGRGELYAALFVLLACWLYLGGREWGGAGRGLRLAGLAVLYFLGLASKEIAVTLPGVLLLVELVRAHDLKAAARSVWDELPAYVLLAATLGVYLWFRSVALGGLLGEPGAGSIRNLTTGERVLTSISLWPEYIRLLFYPVDLAADYGPAVFLASRDWNLDVAVGALVLVLLAVTVAVSWSRERGVALGVLWFALAVLPVSHLFFPTGTVLAERTLYLPSVGLAFVVAGIAGPVLREGRPVRWTAAALLGAAAVALFVRTVQRNPTWYSGHTVMNTLASEHPESFRALWERARSLDTVGEAEEARRYMEAAVELAPNQYRLLLEAGLFHRKHGRIEEARDHIRRAREASPRGEAGHFELANTHLLLEEPREALRVAMEGMEAVGPSARLWGTVSESHIARGDLPAALRARRAALALDPRSRRHWSRLAALLEAMDADADAARARVRASELPAEDEGR